LVDLEIMLLNCIQNYLNQFGLWKCEANALVVRPDAGRQLLEDTMLEYVDDSLLGLHLDNIKAGRLD